MTIEEKTLEQKSNLLSSVINEGGQCTKMTCRDDKGVKTKES